MNYFIFWRGRPHRLWACHQEVGDAILIPGICGVLRARAEQSVGLVLLSSLPPLRRTNFAKQMQEQEPEGKNHGFDSWCQEHRFLASWRSGIWVWSLLSSSVRPSWSPGLFALSVLIFSLLLAYLLLLIALRELLMSSVKLYRSGGPSRNLLILLNKEQIASCLNMC